MVALEFAMKQSKVEIYVHVVWATTYRARLILPHMAPIVYGCIRDNALSLRASVYAINGLEDHVHLAIRLPAMLGIAPLVKQLKGVSSHMINERFQSDDHFSWQQGYGAFSVSRPHLPRVIRYIENQKTRHENDQLWSEWEISYDHVDAQ